jgi:hypothetical protein
LRNRIHGSQKHTIDKQRPFHVTSSKNRTKLYQNYFPYTVRGDFQRRAKHTQCG